MSTRNAPSNMAKPSMFSLLSQNGVAGATTIREASQGHRFPSSASHAGSRCNNCTCSPGLMTRNRRSSLYLKRMMSSSSVSSPARHQGSVPSSPMASPRRSYSSRLIEESDAENSTVVDESDANCENDLNTSNRLEALRNLMKESNLGVYIIPSEDAHQSEYTSNVDQRRSFISGFTGSAGIAIITRDITSLNEKPEGLAFLSTDGRYFTQAANELDFNWTLLKQGMEGVPSWQQCAIDHAALLSLDSGDVVNIGIDPKLITYSEVKNINEMIEAKLKENSKFNVKLVPVRDNLVDSIWADFEDKPTREFKEILKLDDKYTGETTQQKLVRLDELFFKKHDSSTMIVNALDEIIWLLNLRGSDIEYNPLFYSYLVIDGIDNLTLYTDKHERFDENLRDYLKDINCELKLYDDIWFDIRKIATRLHNSNKSILLTEEATWKMVNCIIAKNFKEIDSPIKSMKEIKNKNELEGQIKAQIDDGFAIIKYFAWLEKQLNTECDFISEYEGAMKLLEIRKTLPNFKGLSFETISSTGANAAIIHYSPSAEKSAIINPNKIYLCDSGSQFLNGTTDTTRTLHFNEPTLEEIENYTLVLKGHVSLARLIIPKNKMTGFQIDCIARQFLWNKGLEYLHGTGHGVDAFGPVHSAGVGIGFRPYCNKNTLKAGHLVSNEPGYYKPGDYGIRIENMVYLEEAENIPGFLKFVTTTKVPYCRKLINPDLLSPEERGWINKYHQSIWNLYNEKFEKKSFEWTWLKRETTPI